MNLKNKISTAFTMVLVGAALNSKAQVTEENRDAATPMNKQNYHTSFYPSYLTPSDVKAGAWMNDVKDVDAYMNGFSLAKSDTTDLGGEKLVSQILTNKNGDIISHQMQGKQQEDGFYAQRTQLNIYHKDEADKDWMAKVDLLKVYSLNRDVVEMREKIEAQIKAEGKKIKPLSKEAQAEMDYINKMDRFNSSFQKHRNADRWVKLETLQAK